MRLSGNDLWVLGGLLGVGDRESGAPCLGDSTQFLWEISQLKSGMRVSQELGLNEWRKKQEKKNILPSSTPKLK